MPRFERSIKQLKRPYPNILDDVEDNLENLLNNPNTGTVILMIRLYENYMFPAEICNAVKAVATDITAEELKSLIEGLPRNDTN